jgi:hypothetical protein
MNTNPTNKHSNMLNDIERKVLDKISSLKKVRRSKATSKVKRVRHRPAGKIVKTSNQLLALDEKKLEAAKKIIFGTDKATVKLYKVNRLFR